MRVKISVLLIVWWILQIRALWQKLIWELFYLIGHNSYKSLIDSGWHIVCVCMCVWGGRCWMGKVR